MFPVKADRACHSLTSMMEVGDIMRTLDPATPCLSLFAKSEQAEHQAPGIKDSCSSLVKEPHIQPCWTETVTMDAIASDEKQVRTLAATVGDLEIHFSEACQKRYIVFDQSAGHKSLLCHPTLLNGGPLLVPSVVKNTNNLFTFLQDHSDKAAENILDLCPLSNPSAWGTRLLAYRESMEGAFTALERVKVNGFECSGLKSGEHGLMACPSPVKDLQNKSRVCGDCSCSEQGEGIGSPLHEETEDIDALLSSEEELSSTCHTLVDNSLSPADDGDDHSSSNVRKKRKIQKPDLEEESGDFVQSDADSRQKVMSCCEGKYTCASDLAIPSRNPHISEVSLSKAKGFVSRKNPLWKPLLLDRIGKCEQNTKFFEDTKVVKRAKLIKVKDTFEELKNMIPGGDVDDTVGVLERAVHYIKSLQAKLQKLDGRTEIQVNVH